MLFFGCLEVKIWFIIKLILCDCVCKKSVSFCVILFRFLSGCKVVCLSLFILLVSLNKVGILVLSLVLVFGIVLGLMVYKLMWLFLLIWKNCLNLVNFWLFMLYFIYFFLILVFEVVNC